MDEQQRKSVVSSIVHALKEAWENGGLKDELILDLNGPGRYFWAGTEAGMLGAYGFQGIQAGGDGSTHQRRMEGQR